MVEGFLGCLFPRQQHLTLFVFFLDNAFRNCIRGIELCLCFQFVVKFWAGGTVWMRCKCWCHVPERVVSKCHCLLQHWFFQSAITMNEWVANGYQNQENAQQPPGAMFSFCQNMFYHSLADVKALRCLAPLNIKWKENKNPESQQIGQKQNHVRHNLFPVIGKSPFFLAASFPQALVRSPKIKFSM